MALLIIVTVTIWIWRFNNYQSDHQYEQRQSAETCYQNLKILGRIRMSLLVHIQTGSRGAVWYSSDVGEISPFLNEQAMSDYEKYLKTKESSHLDNFLVQIEGEIERLKRLFSISPGFQIPDALYFLWLSFFETVIFVMVVLITFFTIIGLQKEPSLPANAVGMVNCIVFVLILMALYMQGSFKRLEPMAAISVCVFLLLTLTIFPVIGDRSVLAVQLTWLFFQTIPAIIIFRRFVKKFKQTKAEKNAEDSELAQNTP